MSLITTGFMWHSGVGTKNISSLLNAILISIKEITVHVTQFLDNNTTDGRQQSFKHNTTNYNAK